VARTRFPRYTRIFSEGFSETSKEAIRRERIISLLISVLPHFFLHSTLKSFSFISILHRCKSIRSNFDENSSHLRDVLAREKQLRVTSAFISRVFFKLKINARSVPCFSIHGSD